MRNFLLAILFAFTLNPFLTHAQNPTDSVLVLSDPKIGYKSKSVDDTSGLNLLYVGLGHYYQRPQDSVWVFAFNPETYQHEPKMVSAVEAESYTPVTKNYFLGMSDTAFVREAFINAVGMFPLIDAFPMYSEGNIKRFTMGTLKFWVNNDPDFREYRIQDTISMVEAVWYEIGPELWGGEIVVGSCAWSFDIHRSYCVFSEFQRLFQELSVIEAKQVLDFSNALKKIDPEVTFESYRSVTVIVIAEGAGVKPAIEAFDELLRQAGVEGPKPTWENDEQRDSLIHDAIRRADAIPDLEPCQLYRQLDSLLAVKIAGHESVFLGDSIFVPELGDICNVSANYADYGIHVSMSKHSEINMQYSYLLSEGCYITAKRMLTSRDDLMTAEIRNPGDFAFRLAIKKLKER